MMRSRRPKQSRVDRHRMKLAAFEVVFEPGTSNPCHYGSQHPPALVEGEDKAAKQEQGDGRRRKLRFM